jgi:hypothetical protein
MTSWANVRAPWSDGALIQIHPAFTDFTRAIIGEDCRQVLMNEGSHSGTSA